MIRNLLFCTLCFALLAGFSHAQQPAPPASANAANQPQEDAYIPGDWAPALLDGILSSPNQEARAALLDAALAAGPSIVPQLEAALKDDRTAEFAAQSLAFIGGDQALAILAKLVDDHRDLDLRRFYYAALGEFRTPISTQVLLDALARANAEPDRTVTQAAILALTVRSDLSLLPALREMETKINDVVIRDDVENALEVIEARARYLASPDGKNEGVSVERAIRNYFMPALEPPPTPSELIKPTVKNSGPAKSTTTPHPHTKLSPTKPLVSAEIKRLVFSPDKSRALAHVLFDAPEAVANYDMILQKQDGDWIMASVWLDTEAEKTIQPPPRPKSSLKK